MRQRSSNANLVTRFAEFIPIVRWLPTYNPKWIGQEVIAAITLTAFAIPESMAYAGLAGLAPQFGFYASMLAVLTYAIFGTSRHVAFGPTSALSIVVATSLTAAGIITTDDPKYYASMAAVLAILVAIIALVSRILQLGFLVNFVSDSVLVGFSTGAGLYIASTQLGKLFGIPKTSGEFFERIWEIIVRLNETNVPTLLIGISGILLLWVLHLKFPRLPSTLIVVILAIVLIGFTDLHQQGVKIVGTIPPGLPHFAVPSFGLPEVRRLLPGAFAVFILSYIEGMGVMRFLAKKHRYKVDANQEFVALGVANLICGLGSGFPVGGSMSRSAVNDQMEAKTPLSTAMSGLILMIVLLFFTNLFTNLPEAILAAVVVIAVRRLIDIHELHRLYYVSRPEFAIAIVSLAGVLFFGVVNGVLIGVILSILIVFSRAIYPQIAILGRIPNTGVFVDIKYHPEHEKISRILIYQVHAILFYANTPIILEKLKELVDASDTKQESINLVILDLSTSPILDLAGATMLHELYDYYLLRGINFAVANVSGQAKNIMEKVGLEIKLGEIRTNVNIQTVLTEATRQ